MKFFCRTKTTLIPPSLSSIREIGKLVSKYPQAHPQLFGQLKSFYALLPKGSLSKVKPRTWREKYYAKYIATSSPLPILHFLGVMIPLGYYITYFKGGHYHPRFEFH